MWKNAIQTRTASIVVVMLVAIVPAAIQLPAIRLQNNLETWSSEDDEQARALQRMETFFPKEEPILVSWNTSSLADKRVQRMSCRIALY